MKKRIKIKNTYCSCGKPPFVKLNKKILCRDCYRKNRVEFSTGVATRKQYRKYLHSSEWYTRRRSKLKEAGNRCQKCKRADRLEVHHLTYAKLGNEPLEHLQVLCRNCHQEVHGRKQRSTYLPWGGLAG